MDSALTAPELARGLGVSLPAAHRLLDRYGVPASGKGRVRKAPRTVLDDTLKERGAVTVVFPGMSKSLMRVLAVLSRAPFGLRSARQIAERAGVSPTVASRELATLEAQGLAHRQERTVAADRARVRVFWTTDLRSWPAGLLQAMKQTVLPRAKRRPSKEATRVPARFKHLFWNAELSSLSPAHDASYIGGRMLTSANVGAWVWVLENLPDDGIDTALSRRGMPAAVRALVGNWRCVADLPRAADGQYRLESRTDPGIVLTAADELSTAEAFVPAGTAAAWRALAPVVPDGALLAGGTAIAVLLRHRISGDLGFFMEAPFDVDALIKRVESVGKFDPTLVDDGNVNGIFEGTIVRFHLASGQTWLQAPTEFAGIRLASLPDLMAMKLKAIEGRRLLRDCFDIMCIEQRGGISVEAGLKMLVDRYRPRSPDSVVAAVVRGLGYLQDAANDSSLPAFRDVIEEYWQNRQPGLLRHLAST